MLKDDVLVFFEDAFFAADEGREEPKVFGGQFGCPLAVGLEVEALDEVDYFGFVNGCLDGLGVVLEDADKTLLNVLSVDVFGVFEEEVDPAGQVEFVFAVADYDLFEETIDAFKDVSESHLSYAIHCGIWVVFNVLEPLVQLVNDLDEQLSGSGVHNNLLNGRVGGVPRGHYF